MTHISTWRLMALTLWILVGVLACGDDDQSGADQVVNNTAQNNDNNPQNNDNNPQNNDNNPQNNDNNPQNNAPDPCAGSCREGERCISDGTCRDRFDRSCADDVDCRPDEICQDVGGADACIRQETDILACPGASGCAHADGVLEVGASKRSITPPGYELPRPEFMDDDGDFTGQPFDGGRLSFHDCGLDQLCEGDPGYTGPDFGEADGFMQGAWLAGFSSNRPALHYCPDRPEGRCPLDEPWVGQLAHDDIYARAVVFRQGETSVGMVVVDTIGTFYDETARIRELLDPGVELDVLIVGSTHNHEAPDTMGIWGPGSTVPLSTGAERWWLDHVNLQIADALNESWRQARPAVITAAMGDTGVEHFGVQDSRDPWIFDDDLAVLQARDAESDAVIATLLNWGNHTEALSSRNPWITADYPGYACRLIEEGMPEVRDDNDAVIAEAVEGAGGVAVYIMGAVGGLITPLRNARARDRRGDDWRAGTYEMANAMGEQLAMKTLELLNDATPVPAPDLAFATREFTVPVDNDYLQLAALTIRLLDRDIYNITADLPLDGMNIPYVLSRASIVRLGDAVSFFTIPGEPFPETLVGGYDPAAEYRFTPKLGNPDRVHCAQDLRPHTCDVDEDCPDDWGCLDDLGTCTPTERRCSNNSDCSFLATCDDGRCKRTCRDNDNCEDGFACEDGACVFDPDLAQATGAAFPCMIRPDNINPPDLDAAPEGPYLKEQMPGDVVFSFALGHDQLGYIVPNYDFVLDPDGAYLSEADGDHYEETFSTSPSHLPILLNQHQALRDALP